MLYKYVVAASPTNVADFRQDIASIMSGEMDAANLSDNCHKTLSGLVPASTPLTAAQTFSILKNDATDSIITRKHSKFLTKDIIVDVSCPILSGLGRLKLAVLTGFDGVSRDPTPDFTDGLSSTSYANAGQTLPYDDALNVIYIGVTDSTAFVTSAQATSTAMVTDLYEQTPNNGVYSYTTSSADCTWAVSTRSDIYIESINIPKGSGVDATVLTSGLRQIANVFTYAGSYPTSSMTNTAAYPLPLPDGSNGLPVFPAMCAPVNSEMAPAQYLFGDIHMSTVNNVASLLGKTLSIPGVGDALVLTTALTVNSSNDAVRTFYIPGV